MGLIDATESAYIRHHPALMPDSSFLPKYFSTPVLRIQCMISSEIGMSGATSFGGKTPLSEAEGNSPQTDKGVVQDHGSELRDPNALRRETVKRRGKILIMGPVLGRPWSLTFVDWYQR
jgi:hypothetical protein